MPVARAARYGAFAVNQQRAASAEGQPAFTACTFHMDALAQLDIGNAIDDEGIKQFNIRKNDGGIADAQLADSGFSVAGNLKQSRRFQRISCGGHVAGNQQNVAVARFACQRQQLLVGKGRTKCTCAYGQGKDKHDHQQGESPCCFHQKTPFRSAKRFPALEIWIIL